MNLVEELQTVINTIRVKPYPISDLIPLLCRALDYMRALQDLNKMIVFAENIQMTGTRSEEYENGFWDAVDFVKEQQNKRRVT